jgi:hypothetical protein
MANQWLRLWIDLPNDPKFRTISRLSGQSISAVIAVYIHMLCCAANASERGRTEGWCDEDIATALDVQTEQIIAIREAMQGRLLENDYLTGWEKRQPLKEDGAAERARAWRQAKKEEKELEQQTQTNANEQNQTLDKIREDKNRLDKSKPIKKENNKKKKETNVEINFYDVSQKVIDDFKAHRESKNALITQTVIDRFKSEADIAGISLEDALSICCARNWQGFEARWLLNEQPRARGSPSSQFKTSAEKSADWMARLRGEATDPKVIDLKDLN